MSCPEDRPVPYNMRRLWTEMDDELTITKQYAPITDIFISELDTPESGSVMKECPAGRNAPSDKMFSSRKRVNMEVRLLKDEIRAMEKTIFDLKLQLKRNNAACKAMAAAFFARK